MQTIDPEQSLRLRRSTGIPALPKDPTLAACYRSSIRHPRTGGQMTNLIGRRELIVALGGAAATWPLVVHAQQPAMPVVGFLVSTSPDGFTERLRKFSQGLKEQGFVEGENVAIVYRFADNQADRLPELAADLVRRRVAVIATGGPPATFAAQAATATIPITFLVADDPVRLGLAASLSRPSSNMTGIDVFNAEVAAKRLELLRDLVPGVARIAVLVNPVDAAMMETQLKDVDTAASRFFCGFDPRPKAGSPLIVIPIAPSVPSGSKLSRCGGKGGACRKVGVRRPTLTAPARRRERSAGRDEGMIAPVEQRDGTKERKRWR